MKEDLLGLSVIEENNISCGDCGKLLAVLVISEDNTQRQSRGLNPLSQRFVISGCPRCGGESFRSKELRGSVVVGTLDDAHWIDVDDSEDVEGVLYNKLIMRKK